VCGFLALFVNIRDELMNIRRLMKEVLDNRK
jgi:hypothetical protein